MESNLPAQLGPLEQTVLGGVIIGLLSLLWYILRKFFAMANHHSSQLIQVVQSNTQAITKMEDALEKNTSALVRLEDRLT